MRRLLPALALASLLACPAASASTPAKSAAKKKNAYGAIAWHRPTNSVGYAYDYATARLAGAEALRQCGHSECEVVLSLYNECGALAAGPKAYAARRGFTEAEAQTRTMNACGPGCRQLAWACTR